MLKKEILMGFKMVTLLLATIVIISCASHKGIAIKAHTVKIELKNAIPYCGGAAPDPEMELVRLEPLPKYSLILYSENEDGSRGAELKEIKSDEEGAYNLNLPGGKYQLWLPTKKLSLEKFIVAESPDLGADYNYKDKECFLAWKERPDFSFEINSDTVVSLQYNPFCYTGSHPCLNYTGPYKP